MNSILRSFTQALKALFSNPVRTGLTTLGIIIGISTVILVLSAGAGFRSLIDSQLQAFGTNTLFIETRVPPTTKNRASGASGPNNSTFNAVQVTSLKERDLDSIDKLRNVTGTYGMVIGQAIMSYRDVQKQAMYYGASAARFSIDKHALTAGRFYTSVEETGAAQVAILGSNLAKDMFNADDPLGKFVRVGNLNFQIIGVYEPQGFTGGPADDSLFIPLSTAQKKLLGIDYISMGIVEMADINLADATAEQIKVQLRRNHNITNPDKDDFTITTQAQALETFNTIFSGITILLIAIAAISLIVGGVGIMNIMYVAVTERTPEIGLKKALGARKGDILTEFLIESVLVTVLGGAVGVAFGALLGWLVSLVARSAGLAWQFTVPFFAIVLGFCVSAVIGIGFGVLPARNAAKLNPIDALRQE